MTAIECWDDTNPLVHYGKSFFIFLQATWFAQIIVMLYWPVDRFGAWGIFKWDIRDPRLIANLTFIFGLHIIVLLTSLLVQYLVVRRYFAYRGWNKSVLYDRIEEDKSICECQCRRKLRYELNSDGDDSEMLMEKA